eukprot:5584758-Lingulodinium_polyedra.AAC.1
MLPLAEVKTVLEALDESISGVATSGHDEVVHFDDHQGLKDPVGVPARPETGIEDGFGESDGQEVVGECAVPEQRSVVESIDWGHQFYETARGKREPLA